MRFHHLVAGACALALTSLPVTAQASAAPSPSTPPLPKYHYVSLDEQVLPDGYLFTSTPVAVMNDRRIYGEIDACGEVSCVPSIYTAKGGTITVLHEGSPVSVARDGTVAGFIFTDLDESLLQAAIFRGTKMELIPRIPGEVSSRALSVSVTGSAVVESTAGADGTNSYYLYRRGRKNVPLPGPATISSLGILGGTQRGVVGSSRAYRFFPPFQSRPTVLGPILGDPESQAQAVNEIGDVLGYSYTASGVERIGFWRGSTFHTLFTEGTAEVPTVSNVLRWNDLGLVVVSRTRKNEGVYLIPRRGVRLDLDDLTDAPVPGDAVITDVNERGDLIGYSVSGASFLLERVG